MRVWVSGYQQKLPHSLTSTTRSPWSASHSGIELALHFLLSSSRLFQYPWRPDSDGSSFYSGGATSATDLTHLQLLSVCTTVWLSLSSAMLYGEKVECRKENFFWVFNKYIRFSVPWALISDFKTDFFAVCNQRKLAQNVLDNLWYNFLKTLIFGSRETMRRELFWKIVKPFPILVKNSHFAKNVSLLVCKKLDRFC